ncbi:41661_t:CDS:1, partial [Gigaspora margarita]
VGKATFACIVAKFNKTKKMALLKQGYQAFKDFQTEYVDVIRDQILARNKSGTSYSL